MRIMTILILLNWGASSALAQQWAEEGSQWYYSQYHFNPYAIDSYHKIESTGDTVLNDKNCQKLIWKQISRVDTTADCIYTYESNDSVFFYDSFRDTFFLVYRFDALEGDTIEGMYNRGAIKYWIDSTEEYVLLNGDTTVIQYITNAIENKYLFHISEPIIVGIGALDWLLPNSRTKDPPTGESLKCYIENGDRLYSTSKNCGIISKTTDVNKVLHIGPNPTFDNVSIQTEKRIDRVEIVDISGKVILSEGSELIELPDPPGLYILRFSIDGMATQKRVIKLGN